MFFVIVEFIRNKKEFVQIQRNFLDFLNLCQLEKPEYLKTFIAYKSDLEQIYIW